MSAPQPMSPLDAIDFGTSTLYQPPSDSLKKLSQIAQQVLDTTPPNLRFRVEGSKWDLRIDTLSAKEQRKKEMADEKLAALLQNVPVDELPPSSSLHDLWGPTALASNPATLAGGDDDHYYD